jgi:AcrR family transcriptional regulator
LAIGRAALVTFCQRGYHGTTLDEIAGRVGLTRGALLHHFHSKAALLSAVVDPYLCAFDAVLDDAGADDPPTAEQRRRLLCKLTEVVLANRAEVELLQGDVATRDRLELAEQSRVRRERLITLMVGSQAPGPDRVRATAALGAVLYPAASAWLELDSPEARSAWLEAALAVLAGPGSSQPRVPGRTVSAEGAGTGNACAAVTA